MGFNLFPFHLIPKSSKVILYGAGAVGKQFYQQIKKNNYVIIARWVDQSYQIYQDLGLPVDSPDGIVECDYDYVVIAIANITIADEICRFLQNSLHIDRKYLVCECDSWVSDLSFSPNVYKKFVIEDYSDIVCCDPKCFLNKNRLDLAVRYLLAKDIINGIENDANLSLYSRMILCRTGADEGEYYFSEDKRRGMQDYINGVKGLCESIKKVGFQKEKFIPAGDNGIFLNGAHRIAVSMALKEKIWVKYYKNQKGATNFGEKWFEKNGFTMEDKIRILRGYADLYENCGILLLFGPCMEQWNYLQAQLGKQLSIVGTVELDFTSDYIAFENLFHDIYLDPLWRNVYIDRKLELLKMSPLKIRLLLVSDEGLKGDNLYQTISKVKLELRDRMYFETDIAPIVMHGSDSFGEFVHLKQILLSVNNLAHLRMRAARNYREKFIERLERLKILLKEWNMDLQDICITGSSGWEIFGLRASDDIDFACKSTYRKQYGDLSVYNVAENIDYVRKDSIQVSDECIYQDDLLISDDNYHFIFYDIKFVNLELISRKKRFDGREKDIRDVRLYELFEDYVRNFLDKRLLKLQIENEFYKKR